MLYALNRHEWPEELDSVKPIGFDTMPFEEKHALSWVLMGEAMDVIGLKECLREWNREKLPGEQFDAWWETCRQNPESHL